MKIESFTSLESEVLNLIGQGKNTLEQLSEGITFSDKLLTQTLETLCSKNILIFDTKSKQYKYDSPINKEMIVLEGNILLPTTIIKDPKNNCMYITRGNWYRFPLDFDIRRIIWNVKMVGKNNSTLVDMIRSSVLKERKARITHNSQYDNIRNKILPYSENISLYLNAIGDEITDVTIQFKIYLDKSDQKAPIHRGFNVRSEISTQELIGELKKPVAERDYVKNIKINLIYNLSDFIYSKNEIPVSLIDGVLNYVKISGVKKGYELTYYKLDGSGLNQKIDVETFDNPQEAIEKFRNIFKGLPYKILEKNNILLELQN